MLMLLCYYIKKLSFLFYFIGIISLILLYSFCIFNCNYLCDNSGIRIQFLHISSLNLLTKLFDSRYIQNYIQNVYINFIFLLINVNYNVNFFFIDLRFHHIWWCVCFIADVIQVIYFMSETFGVKKKIYYSILLLHIYMHSMIFFIF